jgi:hypothetical protein
MNKKKITSVKILHHLNAERSILLVDIIQNMPGESPEQRH